MEIASNLWFLTEDKFPNHVTNYSDANIDEKDLVQSDPEIDEDSDVETPMIQKAFSSI